MSKEKQNQEIASVFSATLIANQSDPEAPISQSITGIIVKAFRYMSQQIIYISDTLKNSPEPNDLRRDGTINRPDADISIRLFHERISEMEMFERPFVSFRLLSLNYSTQTFQHSSDRTYIRNTKRKAAIFPFMNSFLRPLA